MCFVTRKSIHSNRLIQEEYFSVVFPIQSLVHFVLSKNMLVVIVVL
jgi:hypothetical protein